MFDTIKNDLILLKEAIAQLEEMLDDDSIEPDELTIEAEDTVLTIEALVKSIKESID